ncbi:MAG TPA: hypothetical protein VM536_06035, partial [Chloroflexia bacterium]|nr:hypothetical protein [Chloroflexia bacterium]
MLMRRPTRRGLALIGGLGIRARGLCFRAWRLILGVDFAGGGALQGRTGRRGALIVCACALRFCAYGLHLQG